MCTATAELILVPFVSFYLPQAYPKPSLNITIQNNLVVGTRGIANVNNGGVCTASYSPPRPRNVALTPHQMTELRVRHQDLVQHRVEHQLEHRLPDVLLADPKHQCYHFRKCAQEQPLLLHGTVLPSAWRFYFLLIVSFCWYRVTTPASSVLIPPFFRHRLPPCHPASNSSLFVCLNSRTAQCMDHLQQCLGWHGPVRTPFNYEFISDRFANVAIVTVCPQRVLT
jgi:hypothetical protein